MSKLNNKQKQACEFMVENPELKVQDVADEFGVDRTTLWRWTKKPEWTEYEDKLCREKFSSLGKLAVEKLKQNATNNNQKAIEYILDYLGYSAPIQLEADVKNQVFFEGEDDLED